MGLFLWGMVAGALGMLVLQAFDRAREKSLPEDPLEAGKMSQLIAANDALRVQVDNLQRLNGQLQYSVNYCNKHHQSEPTNIKWVVENK